MAMFRFRMRGVRAPFGGSGRWLGDRQREEVYSQGVLGEIEMGGDAGNVSVKLGYRDRGRKTYSVPRTFFQVPGNLRS